MVELAARSERLSRLFARGEIVKIDGVARPEHAAAAVAAGADLIGFIFAPARRRVTAAVARSCIAAATSTERGRDVLAVGVFVDARTVELQRIVEEAGIDVIQLHGAEPPEALQGLPAPALKALRPRPGSDPAQLSAEIRRFQDSPEPPLGFVLDGYSERLAGGSGVRADWELASNIAVDVPILLAGGLDPENVGAAIRQVRPRGVDVSSGVETDGVKDPARIEAFIRSARHAFQGLGRQHHRLPGQ